MIARRQVLESGLSIAGIALAAGVGLGDASAAAATPSDTLVIAETMDDMLTLDPAEVFETSGVEIISNIYDRLIRLDPDDLSKIVPGAAESWTVTPDGLTLTFKIRPGMTFHSGHPVTAEDAEFSFRRVVKMDKTPAFYLNHLGWTKGNVDERVKALDPTTLQATIGETLPMSFVLSMIASFVSAIVDKKVVMEHAVNDDFGNRWMKTNSAGSGPFILRSWKANESVSLERFSSYREGPPAVRRIFVRHVPEASAQRLLLEKGDADIARDLTTDQISQVANNKDITVLNVPRGTLRYVALNTKVAPFADVRVRQAMRYLVDYNGMASSFLKGQAIVHQSFWPSGFAASDTDNPFKFDPAKAKSLLAAAGYPNGFEVTLDAGNSSPYTNIAQSLQATMAQGGVKVTILSAEGKSVLTKYRARQHQMLMWIWSADAADPSTNASNFASNPDNADNSADKTAAWRNNWFIPELTKTTSAALHETDAAKRANMYLDLQKTLMDEGPYIFMFQDTKQLAMRRNVKGFKMGPISDSVFYQYVTK